MRCLLFTPDDVASRLLVVFLIDVRGMHGNAVWYEGSGSDDGSMVQEAETYMLAIRYRCSFHMQYVKSNMQCVIFMQYNMQHVRPMCNIQYVILNLQYATCNIHFATCNVQHSIYAIYYFQYAICNLQHSRQYLGFMCNMQYEIFSLQYATCIVAILKICDILLSIYNMQHGTQCTLSW